METFADSTTRAATEQEKLNEVTQSTLELRRQEKEFLSCFNSIPSDYFI
jgi:hypothetical protein